MNRTFIMRALVLVGLVAALGTVIAVGVKHSGSESNPGKAATVSNLIITPERDKADNGTTIQVGPPTITLRDSSKASIADLCAIAIAVNSYGADNPTDEANALRAYCNRATTAATVNDTWTCTNALVDLADNVNTGYNGARHMAAFTNTTVSTACHDTPALSQYAKLGIGNQPIVVDVTN